MLCKVMPIALCDIGSTDYVNAVSALEQYDYISSLSPATEANILKSLNIDNVGAKTSELALNAAVSFNHALGDWEHTISKQLNDCVAMTFSANKKQIKLLTADYNYFMAESRKAAAVAKSKGIPEDTRSQNMLLANDMAERAAQTQDKIHDLRVSIFITPQMEIALKNAMNFGRDVINLLTKFYVEKYKDTLNARYDPKHPRYQLKDTDYCADLKKFAISIRKGGDVYEQFEPLQGMMQDILNRDIYGKTLNTSDGSCSVAYEMRNISEMSKTYDSFKKILRHMHDRASILKRYFQQKQYRDDPTLTDMTAIYEMAFLTEFCNVYSSAMSLYFEPQFSVIQAVVNASK